MPSDKAQQAKDKGNAAFKTGDYPNAIGHYTAAILADRSDITFPLNRAAAYLKLGKYKDAESDCMTVLALNASNVKALFRRGQAKLGLGMIEGAEKDFREALNLEPANELVKQEWKKVEELVRREKSKNNIDGGATPLISTLATAPLKRRRVPIAIVEHTEQISDLLPPTVSRHPRTSGGTGISTQVSENDLLKQLSSRPLTPSSSPQPSTSTPPVESTIRPITFKDAKHARESAKPSRVGGGIFRASGKNTIFRDAEEKRSQPAPPPPSSTDSVSPASVSTSEVKFPPTSAPLNGSTTKLPMTLFNFTRAWEASFSAEGRWQIISEISPSSFPTLFQASLEPSLLISILEAFLVVLQNQYEPHIAARIREYLDAFIKVPRFNTLLLFLSRREKEIVKELWAELGMRNVGSVWSVVF